MLFIDGVPKCFVLEDAFQTQKIYGQTRISAGIYPLRLRNFGSIHASYKKKFAFHKGTIEIANIPGFSDVLIHIGNDSGDTLGCPLVGMSHTFGTDFIGNSTAAYKLIYPEIANRIIAFNDVQLQVIDPLIG